MKDYSRAREDLPIQFLEPLVRRIEEITTRYADCDANDLAMQFHSKAFRFQLIAPRRARSARGKDAACTDQAFKLVLFSPDERVTILSHYKPLKCAFCRPNSLSRPTVISVAEQRATVNKY